MSFSPNKTCLDIIALLFVTELGPKSIVALVEKTSESEEIFHLSEKRFSEIIEKKPALCRAVRTIRTSREYLEEIAYIEREGIRCVCYRDPGYPASLRNIYGMPPILFYRGNLFARDTESVAIVGSRRCSLYGSRIAEKLAFGLAEEGVTVISGMARGIDSAAHRGALKAGGRTIAVIGSGFRNMYPTGSEKLAQAISKNGAVVTEFVSGIRPVRTNFPRRNRIISGLAGVVVVAEAARKSGAMITADLALEQGKEVMAVPGPVDAYTSGGVNYLIQNGAKLVTGAEDILEELNLSGRSPVRGSHDRIRSAAGGTEKEKKVLAILNDENTVHVDRILEHLEVSSGVLSEILLKMELNGLIRRLAGGRYVSDRLVKSK